MIIVEMRAMTSNTIAKLASPHDQLNGTAKSAEEIQWIIRTSLVVQGNTVLHVDIVTRLRPIHTERHRHCRIKSKTI